MMTKHALDMLLEANPNAKKQEKVIRETIRDLRRLRKEGFGGGGYTLMPPFGEKRRVGSSLGVKQLARKDK